MFIGQMGIAAAVNSGQLHFTGAIRGDGLLISAGAFLLPFHPNDEALDPHVASDNAKLYRPIEQNWKAYTLQPHELVLIQSRERILLDTSLIGIIGTLSHLARVGLMAHLASPFVNPGFSGYITLEVFNAGQSPIRLSENMPLAKIMVAHFSQGREVPKRSFYGENGVLGTRYSEDPDADGK